MRLMIVAATAALAVTGPAFGKANPQMKICAAQWRTAPHAGTTYKAFMTSCLHTGAVAPGPVPVAAAAPAAAVVPAAASTAKMTAPMVASPGAATAKCKDGTFSHSAHHSGSCSHHGGVAQFM